MPEERCIRCANRVPWISFWGNSAITFYKITVGFLGGSAALIADGLHSFTDVIGTSVIIGTCKVSDKPADKCHPYGHGKAEFMGSTFIYTVLLFLASAIFVGGWLVIAHGDLKTPRFVTLLAAVVSVSYNVLMYFLGSCAGKRNRSPALLANAFENRADAISSVACIVGITGAILIHPICDPIACMVVGVIIFVNCVIELNKSLSGLMDKGLSADGVTRIKRIALGQEGVEDVDFIKSRQTGGDYWVDLGIVVHRDIHVAHSDRIASRVRNELMRRSEKLHNVEIYVASAPEKEGTRRSFLRRKKKEKPSTETE